MTLSIEYQDRYSRGQLLLRTILGVIYIALPHGLALLCVALISLFVDFLAFWAILFTGRYPRGFFDFNLGFLAWQNRVAASLGNLVDGYPNAGFRDDDNVQTRCAYPESVDRGSALLRGLLGWLYIGLPHGVALVIRQIGTSVLSFLAFWVVLFTGEYPERWHAFNVGTLRWTTRVSAYLAYMTPDYPPFSGTE